MCISDTIEVKKENAQCVATPALMIQADQIGGGSPAGELSVNLAKIGGSPVAESALKVDLDKVKGAAVSATGGVVDVKVNAQGATMRVDVRHYDGAPGPPKTVGGA